MVPEPLMARANFLILSEHLSSSSSNPFLSHLSIKSNMLRDQPLGLIFRECVVHLLEPRAYLSFPWVEFHRLKSPFQNLEKAFAGREKLINR